MRAHLWEFATSLVKGKTGIHTQEESEAKATCRTVTNPSPTHVRYGQTERVLQQHGLGPETPQTAQAVLSAVTRGL